jgi:hypothetical protein
VTATAVGAEPVASARRVPGPDSVWWIILVGVAFVAAELAFVSPKMGLSWDEVVYVSQVSGRVPAAWFDPARARGVPLVVAPVVWLTGSVVALRIYLSVLSGVGLVLTLLVWRPVRQAWVLAVAGVAFGGLWVAQYYGPQAMPDMWSALGSLAAVGFFVRSRHWTSLAGLAGCIALVVLVRPGDGVYLCAPLAVAAMLGRRWSSLLALAAGAVAGGVEWVVEALVRFGGIGARLHAAGAEQGGFGLHFALFDELKALNGPTLCRPCTVGLRQPELDLWWLLLPVVVVLGVIGARRAGRYGSSLLAASCAACLAAQYLFMINYSAPRFLLPAYALAAIPVADAVAWAVSAAAASADAALRPTVIAALSAFMFLQLTAQHVVLDHEAGGTVTFHDDYTVITARLHQLGVRAPCLVSGVQYIPIAYYAGCASAGWSHGTPVLLIATGSRPPSYARHWHAYSVKGTTVLHVTAYLPHESREEFARERSTAAGVGLYVLVSVSYRCVTGGDSPCPRCVGLSLACMGHSGACKRCVTRRTKPGIGRSRWCRSRPGSRRAATSPNAATPPPTCARSGATPPGSGCGRRSTPASAACPRTLWCSPPWCAATPGRCSSR